MSSFCKEKIEKLVMLKPRVNKLEKQSRRSSLCWGMAIYIYSVKVPRVDPKLYFWNVSLLWRSHKTIKIIFCFPNEKEVLFGFWLTWPREESYLMELVCWCCNPVGIVVSLFAWLHVCMFADSKLDFYQIYPAIFKFWHIEAVRLCFNHENESKALVFVSSFYHYEYKSIAE